MQLLIELDCSSSFFQNAHESSGLTFIEELEYFALLDDLVLRITSERKSATFENVE